MASKVEPNVSPTTNGKKSNEPTANCVDDDDDKFKDNPEHIVCNWNANCQPEGCQWFARPSCLLFWLCMASFTQSMVVNGFVNSVLTTLERRYDLSSAESGLIASMYDIGSVLCLVPVTYIGRRYRRSRLISIGALIMAVGSFVFAIPQFTTEAYSYQSPVSPLCYLAGKTYPDFCTKQTLNNYKFVFWLGQFLLGVGASPLYTLGVAYLDDNLTVKQSGLFLGAYYTMSLLGPAMGYGLGGVFLDLYVDPSRTPTDLTSSNTSLWIGAWWIGFLISAGLALVIVVPMFGFPVSFPGALKVRHERKQESHGNSEAMTTDMEVGAKDFCPSVGIIMSNPVFVFISLSGAADAILVGGLSAFGPKMLQTLFYVSASKATLTIGFVSVPSAALGLFIGGLVIRLTNLSVKQILWMCVGVACFDILFGLGLLARCDLLKFAGVNSDYPLTPNNPSLLNATCNANCNCQESKFMYSPLCGADSIIYYSPCFAGCQQNGTLIDGTKYYGNCSCVSGSFRAGGANFSAVEGSCVDSTCNKMPILLAMIAVFLFGIFFLSVPSLQVTMRVIPSKLKDFGLGLQWIIYRLLGSIPGPLVMGYLIDSTCSLWTGGCGRQGSCSFYNGQGFWMLLLIFAGVLKLLEILFMVLATVTYKPPPDAGAGDTPGDIQKATLENQVNQGFSDG